MIEIKFNSVEKHIVKKYILIILQKRPAQLRAGSFYFRFKSVLFLVVSLTPFVIPTLGRAVEEVPNRGPQKFLRFFWGSRVRRRDLFSIKTWKSLFVFKTKICPTGALLLGAYHFIGCYCNDNFLSNLPIVLFAAIR